MMTLGEPVLRWAAAQVAVGARVVAARGLKDGGSPWLLGICHGGQTVRAVLRVGDPEHPERLATEAAALAVAADHGLAVPRLLGADLAGTAGVPLLLVTALQGSSRIPAVASAGRLRAVGAAAAALHAVALTPRPELPLRVRPIAEVDFAAKRRAGGTTPLVAAADARLEELPVPASAGTVLVHGDLWQGNTLWAGGTLVGVVDWECAGVGHPGVDVGWLRYDAAVLFGPAAAAEVLAGWQRASGRALQAMAYWDVVAALSTPPDLAAWVPVFRREGRGDLDAATLTARRDAFLRAALGRLGRHEPPRR